MLKKSLKYLALAILCLIVLVPSSALLYRKYRQYLVAKARRISSPNGINLLEPVRIGGIDQWIQVRGQDLSHPILLFIHGGPGIAFIPLAGSFQQPWENYFTVVQWDQRGAGKTLACNDKDLQRRAMTLPQMERDALDVANYLRTRFHRDKIFVLGHSWGSVLGLWLAHEHPDIFYGYIGTGQVVNMAQNEAAGYQDALQQARATHRQQAIAQLESIAPYPPSTFDLRKGSIVRYWEGTFLSPPPTSLPAFTDVRRILSDVLTSPDYSLADDLAFVRGQQLALNTLLPSLAEVELDKLGPDFSVPVFFFEGRHDPFCRPSLIWDYTQAIHAPQKGFVWFEQSGHFPFYQEPQKFLDELVHRVLPLANSSLARN